MHTVEIEGNAQPDAVYLMFTEGLNVAYTYLTTGPSTGSFYIFNEPYLVKVCSPFIIKTIINSLNPSGNLYGIARNQFALRTNLQPYLGPPESK